MFQVDSVIRTKDSSGDMTSPYRGAEEQDSLLRELLTNLKSLGRRQRPRAEAMVLSLFTVDLRPLDLMAVGQQRGPGVSSPF